MPGIYTFSESTYLNSSRISRASPAFDSYAAELERTADLVSQLSLDCGISVSRVFVSEHNWENHNSPFLASVREDALPV